MSYQSASFYPCIDVASGDETPGKAPYPEIHNTKRRDFSLNLPVIRFGKPRECNGRRILPVVSLFFNYNRGSVLGSATVLALFVVEGEHVYFSALSEEITLEEILACLGSPVNDRLPLNELGKK